MLTKLGRLFKHRWHGDTLARRVVSPQLLARLTQAVQASEQHHSGEIRVAIEGGLPLSYLWRDEPLAQVVRNRALSQFGKLRVWDTAQNNGVLIYLLLVERAIEIVADRGLNDKVDPASWLQLVESMRGAFQAGEFESGLKEAVAQVDRLLVTHFPLAPGQSNPNELPDAPSAR